jgi:hypothetical protein
VVPRPAVPVTTVAAPAAPHDTREVARAAAP